MEQKSRLDNLSDLEITCSDCGQPFIFTSGEQIYFIDHCLNVPKRCPRCRVIRKIQQVGGKGGQ